MPTLKRTGDRPVKFSGELLSEASSGGHDANRWHELALYRTEAGQFVLSIEFRTQWQGELGHRLVEVCADMTAVSDTLRAYDPIGYLKPFPESPQFRAKQELRNRDIIARYGAAVSELLQDEPEEI